MRTPEISVSRCTTARPHRSAFRVGSISCASWVGSHIVMSLFVASMFLVLFPCVSVGEIDWSAGAKVSKKPSRLVLSPLEMGAANDVWRVVISSSYRVSPAFVTSLYDKGYRYDEIVPMLEMARVSRKDPSETVPLRKRGLGWAEIARRWRVRLAAMDKAGGKDPLFKRYLLAQCLAGYYGINDSASLVLLNERGFGFDEIAIAVNVCANSGAPLRDVIAARATKARWKTVAEKFKMLPEKLGRPPAGAAASSRKPAS